MEVQEAFQRGLRESLKKSTTKLDGHVETSDSKSNSRDKPNK